MRGIFWSLLLVCLVLCTGVRCVLAAEGAADPDVVQITPQDGGGYLVSSTSYQARIAADGNLHSLCINGIEFLDDHVAGSLGAAFFFEKPIELPTLTLKGLDITSTNSVYTIRYHFEPGYIQLYLQHKNPKGAAFVAVCSQKIAFIEDLTTETVAAVPAEYQWSDVQVTAPTGEFLQFHAGSRAWGREINHQVWECSNMVPDKVYPVMLIPGRDKPPAPGLDQLTTLSVSMNNADQLIPAGEPVTLQVHFDNNSNQLVTTQMAMHVESSQGKPIPVENQQLVCEAHQSVTLTWTVKPEVADFYRVVCSANLGAATKTYATTFGYDTAAIALPAQRPADFNAYWARIVAEAQAADIKITRIDDPTRSTGMAMVYEVGIEADGVRLFSGWLSVPKYQARYPGLLVLPADRANTISPMPKLAERGFVVLCIEPNNQPSIRAQLKPLIGFVGANGFNNKNTFGLRPIMVHCLQAITALASVPEVDPNRLAVTGYGLGGGMSLMLAALDERVQAVAPDVPYYCCIGQGQDRSSWPYKDVLDFLKKYPEQRADVMNTLSYFDAANFADAITCPVFISAGINDVYSRPENIATVYNHLAGPRMMKIYLAGHEGGASTHSFEKVRWLTKILGGPSPMTTAPAPAPARVAPENPAPVAKDAVKDAAPDAVPPVKTTPADEKTGVR